MIASTVSATEMRMATAMATTASDDLTLTTIVCARWGGVNRRCYRRSTFAFHDPDSRRYSIFDDGEKSGACSEDNVSVAFSCPELRSGTPPTY